MTSQGGQPRRACPRPISSRSGRPPWPISRRLSASRRRSSWQPSVPTGRATATTGAGPPAGTSGSPVSDCRRATAPRPLAVASRLRPGPPATCRLPGRRRRPARRFSRGRRGCLTWPPRRRGSSCACAAGARGPVGGGSAPGPAQVGRRPWRPAPRPPSCWERGVWAELVGQLRPTWPPCGGGCWSGRAPLIEGVQGHPGPCRRWQAGSGGGDEALDGCVTAPRCKTI